MQALKEVVRDRAGQGLNTIELALGTESAINRGQSQQQGRESAAGQLATVTKSHMYVRCCSFTCVSNNRDLHSDVINTYVQ